MKFCIEGVASPLSLSSPHQIDQRRRVVRQCVPAPGHVAVGADQDQVALIDFAYRIGGDMEHVERHARRARRFAEGIGAGRV